jgi:hypothetical protein
MTAIRGAQPRAAEDTKFPTLDPLLIRFVRWPRGMNIGDPIRNRRVDACEMILARPPQIARCFRFFTVSPQDQTNTGSFTDLVHMIKMRHLKVQACDNDMPRRTRLAHCIPYREAA